MATITVLSPTAHSFEMTHFPFPKSHTTSLHPPPAAPTPPTPPPPQIRAPRPKPKLQLNTVAVTSKQTLGQATSLRLDTLNATTPTTRNTYKNTFNSAEDLSATSDHRFGHADLRTVTFETPPPSSPFTSANVDTHRSPTSSQLLKRRRSLGVPYQPDFPVRSILVNGPFEKRRRLEAATRGDSITQASPVKLRHGNISKLPPKRVGFKDPLCEDIQNKEYMLKHSDLRSPLLSPSPLPQTFTFEESSPGSSTVAEKAPPPRRSEIAANAHGEAVDSNGLDDSRPPKTPVAGRMRKEREWTWTLGPLPNRTAKPPDVSTTEFQMPQDDDVEEDLEQSLGETVAAASAFSSSGHHGDASVEAGFL